MKKKSNKPIIRLINIHQAKTNLSSLLKEVVENNASIKICKNGEPLAELRKITNVSNPLLTNNKLSKIVFNEDPVIGVDNFDWPEEDR